jgi:hypothetical protein
VGGRCWKGSIDDVRIYNRALSPTEVSALYAYTGSSGGGSPMMRRRRESGMFQHHEDNWEKKSGLWQMNKRIAA